MTANRTEFMGVGEGGSGVMVAVEDGTTRRVAAVGDVTMVAVGEAIGTDGAQAASAIIIIRKNRFISQSVDKCCRCGPPGTVRRSHPARRT